MSTSPSDLNAALPSTEWMAAAINWTVMAAAAIPPPPPGCAIVTLGRGQLEEDASLAQVALRAQDGITASNSSATGGGAVVAVKLMQLICLATNGNLTLQVGLPHSNRLEATDGFSLKSSVSDGRGALMYIICLIVLFAAPMLVLLIRYLWSERESTRMEAFYSRIIQNKPPRMILYDYNGRKLTKPELLTPNSPNPSRKLTCMGIPYKEGYYNPNSYSHRSAQRGNKGRVPPTVGAAVGGDKPLPTIYLSEGKLKRLLASCAPASVASSGNGTPVPYSPRTTPGSTIFSASTPSTPHSFFSPFDSFSLKPMSTIFKNIPSPSFSSVLSNSSGFPSSFSVRSSASSLDINPQRLVGTKVDRRASVKKANLRESGDHVPKNNVSYMSLPLETSLDDLEHGIKRFHLNSGAGEFETNKCDSGRFETTSEVPLNLTLWKPKSIKKSPQADSGILFGPSSSKDIEGIEGNINRQGYSTVTATASNTSMFPSSESRNPTQNTSSIVKPLPRTYTRPRPKRLSWKLGENHNLSSLPSVHVESEKKPLEPKQKLSVSLSEPMALPVRRARKESQL